MREITEPIGRQSEQKLIDGLLDAALQEPVGLIIEGEAGIGKTCLWAWASNRAQTNGFRVLRAQPSEAESTLAFAALGDLLSEAAGDVLPRLPTPQARALEIALLLRDPGDDACDLRAVSVACLSALRHLAESQPILIAIDDEHWLDPSTRRVLTFAARRLGGASFLLSIRTPPAGPQPLELDRALASKRLRHVRLGPLSLAALHHVIRGSLGAAVSRASLLRIERTSGGNPFYAIELARVVNAPTERRLLVDPLSVPPSLRAVTVHIAALTSKARWACLLASAVSHPTVELLAKASNASVVEGAVRAGVLEIDDRGGVSFRHPILAATLYRDASVAERRRAHRYLADVSRDPEEGGRHLALAAQGPDERVARALDAAADRARRRGATDAAAELAELARNLTPATDKAGRARRGLAMARDLLQLGDTSGAQSTLEQVMPGADGSIRSHALLLLARIEWLTASSIRALELAEAALFETTEPVLEAEIRIETAFLSKGDRRRGAAHARRAVAILENSSHERTEPLLARALAAVLFVECDLGLPLSAGLAKRALALAPRVEPQRVSERVGYYVGNVLWQYDDLEGARPLLEEALRAAREEGHAGSLTLVLDQLSQLEVLAGAWTKARHYAREQCDEASLSDQEMERLWGLETLASIDAREGKLAAAKDKITEVVVAAGDVGDPMTIAFALRTSGFIALSEGDAAGACDAFAETTHIADRIGLVSPAGLRHEPDHVEALIELGRLADASAVVDRFEKRGRRARLPWARAATSRCRALLCASRGEHERAASWIAKAVRQHARVSMPFELGRTLLVQGIIHRRRKEKRAAREAFERASTLFDELGSKEWARRSRDEANRVGLRTRSRLGLTETERRVAQLAASGLSNPEISARLFMSRKTVEFNLGKVYAKLGVRGRTQLPSRLEGPEANATF